MTKTKKVLAQLLQTIAVLMLCILITPIISSCSGHDEPDNDKKEKSVVGTWRCDFEDGYQLVTFDAKGNYTVVEIDYESGNWSEIGTYEIKGNKIYTTEYGEVHTWIAVHTILALTETKLIIRLEEMYQDGVLVPGHTPSDRDIDEFYRVE